MILFRKHIGGFRESMRTTKQFEDMEALKKELGQDIKFEDHIYDERNHWDTWYVIKNGTIIGMSNSNK